MSYHSAHSVTEGCCPLQDDLICLPPKVAAPLGNMGPVVFCSRVTNTVQLTDPLTLRTVPLEVSRAASETGTRQWKPLHTVLAALYQQTLQYWAGCYCAGMACFHHCAAKRGVHPVPACSARLHLQHAL